jgi:uncharacterized protein YebE (UPF0316 family)
MSWTVLGFCVLIVLGRVADVSLGTLRTVMVVTGRRGMAFALGFCEVLIWITIVGHLITNLDHWMYYPAYALGFALGCFTGMTIERKLAFGNQMVQVFSRDAHVLATALRAMSFGERVPHLAVTEMEARGHKGPVGVLFVEVPRRFAEDVTARILEVDASAYFIIDDVRHASTAASRVQEKRWWSGFMQRK